MNVIKILVYPQVCFFLSSIPSSISLGLLETIYVLCFSLILLSIDLTSPHVKNKMSKREFIRNTRRAVINGNLSDELAGHLYDNIYLVGHVAHSATIAH